MALVLEEIIVQISTAPTEIYLEPQILRVCVSHIIYTDVLYTQYTCYLWYTYITYISLLLYILYTYNA